jgi:glucose/arabinose dehydrogenase
MTHSSCRILFVIALALGLTGLLVGTVAQAVTTFPPGFAQTAVFTGHTKPVSVRFAPNGQIFVGEQNGLVWAYDNLNDTTATLVIDVSVEVHSFWDRGMLGLAVDPAYPARPYLYIFYAHNVDENGVGPRWFDPDDPLNPNDICPTPPGANVDGCVIYGRLSRVIVDTTTMTGVEDPLLDGNWCQQFSSHSTGDLVFGGDGMLYAAAGEGASFLSADFGQFGSPTGEAGVPINPCGDPPDGVGEFPAPPHDVTGEGGALRSQDLLTPADRTDLIVPDPTSFDGTILRLDVSDESELPKVPADNPLAGGTVLDDDYIIAMGLRSPYRMAWRPGTGELWLGEVGWFSWEEINRVGDVLGEIENFGWPCYSGDNIGSAIELGYDQQTLCIDLYADNIPPGLTTTAPYYAYHHDEQVVDGEECITGSSSVSGIAFYAGANYPSDYVEALAFADSSRRCVWTMFTPPGGDPDKTDILALVSNATGQVVDVQMAPDGNLYYVEYQLDNTGKVWRVQYTPTNDPPLVYITQPLDGSRYVLSESIDFSGSASDTEDGDLTASLAWTSSIDGSIGTGGSFSTSSLSLGLHTITAQTTDSGSALGSSSILIQVVEEQIFADGFESGDTGAWSGVQN